MATDVVPDNAEPGYLDTVKHLKQLGTDEELEFLSECSPRLSPYVTAVVLQDLRKGENDTNLSVERALKLACEQGLPPLQLDAQRVLDTQRRCGRLVDTRDIHNEVTFGRPTQLATCIETPATVAKTKWYLLDYGDSLPTKQGDPILDVYHPGAAERNKCLIIHLDAALLWAPVSRHQNPDYETKLGEIHRLSRDLRYRQYVQTQVCLPALEGCPRNGASCGGRAAVACTRLAPSAP